MKLSHLGISAILLVAATAANAASSVERVGECYVSQGNSDSAANSKSCTVSVTTEKNSKTTLLKMPNDNYVINATHSGNNHSDSLFTVDGMPAKFSLRNAVNNEPMTQQQLEAMDADVLTCYKTVVNNICHN